MPDCVALAIHTPDRHDRSHGRLQDRPDADRRRTLRRSPVRRARRSRVCWRCSPTAPTSTAAASPARKPRSLTPSRRSSPAPTGRIIVAAFCVEHLPDADPGGPGGAVRSQGRVRRARHDRELADRAAPRLPAYPGRPADSRLRRAELSGAGRAVPVHRIAGRTDVGAVAHRHRRSSSRQARAGGHGRALGARRSPATRRRSAASSITSRAAAPT